MRVFLKILCADVILALACSTPAIAANIGGMDIPYANFTDKDRAIFHEALDRALDNGADGATLDWSNPETKARGEIKPVKTFDRAGTPCRTVNISNHAKGRSASGPFTLCKDAAGKWKLTPAEAKAKAAPKPASGK
jgi:surface antigen